MPIPLQSRFQGFTGLGELAEGYKLYFFNAGTDTPADTYTDETGNTANTNPVILDARGEAPIWLNTLTAYKVQFTTDQDAVIWTDDNIQVPNAGGMSYQPSGNGASAVFVQDELDVHIVSALRFMSEVQRNDVLGRVGSVDVHAAFQKVIDYAMTNQCQIDVVPGFYFHGDTFEITDAGVDIQGRGNNTVFRRSGDFGPSFLFTGNDTTGAVLQNCGLSDIVINTLALSSTGALVHLNGCFQFNGKNVYTLNGFQGFRLSGCRQVWLNNYRAVFSTLYGGSVTDRIGFLFDAAGANYTHRSGAAIFMNSPFVLGNIATPVIQHSYKVTCGDGIWFADGYGGQSDESNFCIASEVAGVGNHTGLIFIDNLMMDSGFGHGLHFKGATNDIFNVRCDGLYLHGNATSTTMDDEHGIYAESGISLTDCEFNNITVYGTTKNGVRLLAGQNMTFSDLVIRGASTGGSVGTPNSNNNVWSSIYLENTTDVRFKGGAAGYNYPYTGEKTAKYGIEFGTGNSDVTFDMDLNGNISGSLSGGTNQYRAASSSALDKTPALALLQNLEPMGGYKLNGTTNWLDGTTLTGITDTKKGTFAAKLRFANASGATEIIVDFTGVAFRVSRTSAGNFNISAENVGGTTILNQSLVSDIVAAADTYFILASWDLAVPGSFKIYINDISHPINSITFTNDTIDYTVAEVSVGAQVAGASPMTGDLYVVAFDETVALDFDDAAVRRRFFERSGNLVNWGPNGATAFGLQPRLFLIGDVGSFPTNRGTGTGAFVENGTPATATVGTYEYPDAMYREFTVTAATYVLGKGINSVIGNRAGGTITVTLADPTTAESIARGVITLRTTQNQAIVSASSNVIPLTGGAAGTAMVAATSGKWVQIKSNGTSWQAIAGN